MDQDPTFWGLKTNEDGERGLLWFSIQELKGDLVVVEIHEGYLVLGGWGRSQSILSVTGVEAFTHPPEEAE